jgi:maltose alpha-D-glucosyltransferase/alpha-amylase
LRESPTPTRLRLLDHANSTIEDLFGGSGFDPVPADGSLSLTMGSRDFFWLRLVPPDPSP